MDKCPCGSAVVVDSVTPDIAGWFAHCYSDHKLYLTDLTSPPVMLDEVKTWRT